MNLSFWGCSGGPEILRCQVHFETSQNDPASNLAWNSGCGFRLNFGGSIVEQFTQMSCSIHDCITKNKSDSGMTYSLMKFAPINPTN